MEVLINVENIKKYLNTTKDNLTLDELEKLIENLYISKTQIEQELKELKRDVEDNYRLLTVAEQLGF